MASDDELLEGIARDGTMDYSQWPGLCERILPRLEHIVHNDFPIPTIPLPEPLPHSLHEDTKPDPSSDSSQKENAHPDSPSTRPLRPSPSPLPFRPISINSLPLPPGALPPPLISLLSSIQTTLKTSFATFPPHTAQRLAELLLRPRNHYRTLPSYLRAVDRVISVSSPLSVFPLPSISSPDSNNLTNGLLHNGSSPPSATTASISETHNDDEDDFIGGAALTPIPWLINTTTHHHDPTPTRPLTLPTNSDLRTESTSLIDGPNGSGSIETVSVTVNGISSSTHHSQNANRAGISQGELLRQEQEAGVVPVPIPQQQQQQHSRVTRSSSAARKEEENATNPTAAAAAAAAAGTAGEETEERVHARGPEFVGMEDMGPQARGPGSGRFDVEGALGRRGEGERVAGVGYAKEEGKGEVEGGMDADGDVVVKDVDADAEGVVEGEGREG